MLLAEPVVTLGLSYWRSARSVGVEGALTLRSLIEERIPPTESRSAYVALGLAHAAHLTGPGPHGWSAAWGTAPPWAEPGF
jgi:hypothetical protein